MYFVLYDKNFIALDGTHPVEKFTLQRRSYDFNAFKVSGTKIDPTIDPFWISLNAEDGGIEYMTLCGIPSSTKDGKTEIESKCLKTVFKNEVVLDFANNTFTYVGAMFQYVWTAFTAQIDIGFPIAEFDTSAIDNIEIIAEGEETEKKIYNAWDWLKAELYYYNLHLDYVIEPNSGTVSFIVNKNDVDVKDVMLEDYGIDQIEKVIGDVNMAAVWDKDLTALDSVYYLYSDNTIGTDANSELRILPPKCKIYHEDTISASIKTAVLDLALARYYENININVSDYPAGERIRNVDFSTSFRVYAPNLYKTLPIGEIETNEKGSIIIKLGFRPQELTQLL